MSSVSANDVRRILNRKDRGMLCRDFLNALSEIGENTQLEVIYKRMKLHAYNLQGVMPVILEDYLVPFGFVEERGDVVIITKKGSDILETINDNNLEPENILDAIESVGKGVIEPLSTKELITEIKEVYRPRVFVDIRPFNSGVLEVVLRNSGKSPAYSISCNFDPDLPYHNRKISDLSIFQNLAFLEQGQEIKFVYESLFTIINTPDHPKITKVTINYHDSKKVPYTEYYQIDLQKYVGLSLSSEATGKEIGISDELREIRKDLQSLIRNGLLVKTPKDIANEKENFRQDYSN